MEPTQPDYNPYAAPESLEPAMKQVPVLGLRETSVPCPGCGSANIATVPYNPLVGRAGPRAIDHVRCNDCGVQFNGESGKRIRGSVLRHLLPIILLAMGIAFVVVLSLFG